MCFGLFNYHYSRRQNGRYCLVGNGVKIHGRQGKAFSNAAVIFVICDIDATLLT
jgi:hypothetical protein